MLNVTMKHKFKSILILGPPGAGKSTQGKIIKQKLNLHHICAGDLLRKESKKETPVSNLINLYIKEGKFVPVEIICGLLREEMERNKNKYEYFLLDGFPRNKENLRVWKNKLEKEIDLKASIVLDCDEKTIKKRIKARSKIEGRLDDEIETLEKRIVSYKRETIPVINKLSESNPVIRIDGAGDIYSINQKILTSLRYLL